MKPFSDLGPAGQRARLRQLVSRALTHYDLDVTSIRPLATHFNTIFRQGYTSVRPWPETDTIRGNTFSAARQLELTSAMAHETDPALASYLPGTLARAERRSGAWLQDMPL